VVSLRRALAADGVALDAGELGMVSLPDPMPAW